METAAPVIAKLGVPEGVPIITRDMVAHAKPDPDLFLAAIDRLGVDPAGGLRRRRQRLGPARGAARRHAWASALLSGGYGTEELERAGAYRVYDDPAMLLAHLDELGVREG